MIENIQITAPPETVQDPENYAYELHRTPTGALPDFSDKSTILAVLPPQLVATMLANGHKPAFAQYEDSPYILSNEGLPLSAQPAGVRRQIGEVATRAFSALLTKRSAAED